MRRVALAVCILAFTAGINPLVYAPVACGEEPTRMQLACEFGYFFSQNLAAFLLMMELKKVIGPRYTMPGLILLAAKMAMEIWPLFGYEINGYLASILFFTVLTYVLILIFRWETCHRK